jgi:hypothetical protein
MNHGMASKGKLARYWHPLPPSAAMTDARPGTSGCGSQEKESTSCVLSSSLVAGAREAMLKGGGFVRDRDGDGAWAWDWAPREMFQGERMEQDCLREGRWDVFGTRPTRRQSPEQTINQPP